MDKKIIKSADMLVTTHEARRNGFIEYALRRNKESVPFIDRSKALKAKLQNETKKYSDVLKLVDIYESLVEAAGVSVKAKAHLSDDDKKKMLEEFVDKVLKPSGNAYVDEIIYRYLLTSGDALGGKMRNIVGSIANEKFTRYLISQLQIKSLKFDFFLNKNTTPQTGSLYSADDAENIKAIKWSIAKKNRLVVFNTNVPQIKKNIDIVIIDKSPSSISDANFKDILKDDASYVAFGELKGGIDPAGADEHWKTANTALGRLRNHFKSDVNLFFVGAAIESAMSKEIYAQCEKGDLSNCANLTSDEQLISLCDWLTRI